MTTTNSNSDHDSLRTRLIQVGLHLITTEGYDNLSLRKVAKLCDVSHNAPYKHFTNKEELVQAIMQESLKQFQDALYPILIQYATEPKKQIIELGVAYVAFMANNPDYLKFSFMSHPTDHVTLKNGTFLDGNYMAFDSFKTIASAYLQTVSTPTESYDTYILSMWSLVHGLACLISNGSLTTNEPIESVVRRTLTITLDTMFPTTY